MGSKIERILHFIIESTSCSAHLFPSIDFDCLTINKAEQNSTCRYLSTDGIISYVLKTKNCTFWSVRLHQKFMKKNVQKSKKKKVSIKKCVKMIQTIHKRVRRKEKGNENLIKDLKWRLIIKKIEWKSIDRHLSPPLNFWVPHLCCLIQFRSRVCCFVRGEFFFLAIVQRKAKN